MMDIYLNEKKVDLAGDNQLVGTYATNEIGDIKSRQGVFTNTYKLPGNNRNRNILESADIVNNVTSLPYKRLSARIDVKGATVLMGWAVIVSATTKEYEIQIVGGNAEWYLSIGNKSLLDIDLNEFNHNFTPADIDNSRINHINYTDGYVYPNAEIGRTFAPDYPTYGVGWALLRPSIYCKLLFERIINNAGFQPFGDWWDNNELLFDPTGIVDSAGTATNKFAACIPFCTSFKRNRNYDLRNKGKVDTPVLVYNVTLSLNVFTFTNVIYYPTNGWQFVHPVSNIPTILDSATITLRLELNYTLPYTSIIWGLSIEYTDENGQPANLPITIPNTAGTHSITEITTLSVSQTKILYITTLGQAHINSASLEILDYQPLELTEDELLVTVDFPFVTANSLLPDIKQIDFLKFFFNRFNLIFNTDSQTSFIEFVPFDTILQNIPKAYDWSKKLDLSQQPVVDFIVGNYGQRTIFSDFNDEENRFTNNLLPYIQGELLVNNENLPIVAEGYNTEFSPIYRQMESFGGFIRLGYVPKYRLIDPSLTLYDPNDDSLFEEIDCAPYIGLIRFEPYHTFNITGLTNITDAPALHGYAITWGQVLKNYYKTTTAILNKSKVVTCLIRLKVSDIADINFLKPVWIDYFNCYFYINKIEQFSYTSNQSTKVELIKIDYDVDVG